MLMVEYIDKIDLLSASIRRIRFKLSAMGNKTSPEYHKLRKEEKRLKKQRDTLERECYGLLR